MKYTQHDPAHIRLTVINSGSLPFAANLPAVGENTFEANSASWVFLIGSPRLVVEQVGDITLITSRQIWSKRAGWPAFLKIPCGKLLRSFLTQRFKD